MSGPDAGVACPRAQARRAATVSARVFGSGDEDRLPRPLRERELLQVTHDDGISWVWAQIVEHVHARSLELTDERQRLLRFLCIDLRGVPVARETEGHRPRPYRIAAEFGSAPSERHESGLVIHPDDDQGMSGGEEDSKVAGPVHRPGIIAGSADA